MEFLRSQGMRRCGTAAEKMEEGLKAWRNGDKKNMAITARLRKETTMTLKWIAEHLEMGSWTHVSNLLAATRRRKRR